MFILSTPHVSNPLTVHMSNSNHPTTRHLSTRAQSNNTQVNVTYSIHYTTSRLSSCTNKRKQVELNNKPKAKGGANMYSKPVQDP